MPAHYSNLIVLQVVGEDLDGDGHVELLIVGSKGICRYDNLSLSWLVTFTPATFATGFAIANINDDKMLDIAVTLSDG